MNSRTHRKAVVTSAVSTLLGIFAFGVSLCAAPADASAQTRSNVYFSSGSQGYIGRVYQPNLSGAPAGYQPPGIVMMHGCTGMWSNSVPPTITCSGGNCTVASTPIAQSHIEKWGRKLADEGYVALAIDSFTTRTPPNVTTTAYQQQCNGDTYGGAVDPYTTRTNDFLAAKNRLHGTYNVSSTGVGELGWSQGAETALVNAAITSRTTDTEWCALGTTQCQARADSRPQAVVVFYPGCGANLGYGYSNQASPGFWRPDVPVRWNHGELDTDTPIGPCEARADRAVSFYAEDVDFEPYDDADHSFDRNDAAQDGSIYAFATTSCTPTQEATYPEMCDRWDADMDSLNFILANVQGSP
jgi:dienelactone hydrolase